MYSQARSRCSFANNKRPAVICKGVDAGVLDLRKIVGWVRILQPFLLILDIGRTTLVELGDIISRKLSAKAAVDVGEGQGQYLVVLKCKAFLKEKQDLGEILTNSNPGSILK